MTKPSILQSRKFWITVSDAVFSVVTMIVTFLLSDKTEIRVLVLGILATLQPVIIALINGIATEDAAVVTAEATKSVANTVATGAAADVLANTIG
jgi:hypothetical protein